MPSRNFRDFAGAALALSRISLMPDHHTIQYFITVGSKKYHGRTIVVPVFYIRFGWKNCHPFILGRTKFTPKYEAEQMSGQTYFVQLGFSSNVTADTGSLTHIVKLL